MKTTKIIFYATLVCAMLSLSGCSAYYKLLQTDDAMAKYDMGMEYYNTTKYSKAATLFDSAMPMLMGTPYEDTTLFTLGKLYFATRSYETSAETMDSYRNKFPRSNYTPEAEYIRAMSFYNMSPVAEKDQQSTRRAITAFIEYINRYPDSPFTPEIKELTEELNRKLYYKKYINAAMYYKLGYYQSAVTSLRAVLKENPESPYRKDILYLICKSWFDYAKKSVYSKQLDRYLNSIDAYYNFKTSFPDSRQFGRELERMKNYAQDFVDQNGVTSQSLETSAKKIEEAKADILKSKDELFLARSKQERRDLHDVIKKSREIVRVEGKKSRAEAKIMRQNDRVKDKEMKEFLKEEKAIEKAEQEAAKEAARQRIEELKDAAAQQDNQTND